MLANPDDLRAMEAAIIIPYETQPPRPIASDNVLATVVYALYGASYFIGFTVLVGLVIAYVKIDKADPVSRSHYRFQIRTFWIGLLYLALGTPLCLLLIGFPILVWWFVWSIVRIVKGGLLVLEHKPVAKPESWLVWIIHGRRSSPTSRSPLSLHSVLIPASSNCSCYITDFEKSRPTRYKPHCCSLRK